VKARPDDSWDDLARQVKVNANVFRLVNAGRVTVRDGRWALPLCRCHEAGARERPT